MPTSQATVSDLTKRMLRPLTDPETAWASTALDDAFLQLLVKVPGLSGKLDDATVPPDDPIRLLTIAVQSAMAKRVLANPDGILEETTDDYTRRLDAAVSSGQLQPTDAEIELLSVEAGDPEGAFSVRAMPERPPVWDYFPTTSTDTWPQGALRFGYGSGRIW